MVFEGVEEQAIDMSETTDALSSSNKGVNAVSGTDCCPLSSRSSVLPLPL